MEGGQLQREETCLQCHGWFWVRLYTARKSRAGQCTGLWIVGKGWGYFTIHNWRITYGMTVCYSRSSSLATRVYAEVVASQPRPWAWGQGQSTSSYRVLSYLYSRIQGWCDGIKWNGHSIKFDVMVIQKHADKILSLDQASSSSGYHDQYTHTLHTVTVAHHHTFYSCCL